ncbi:S-adenosylmethionine-dependent methyltransferase [Arthrobacter crystallopoietes BAB-32]|uniref:S-adenosylmethionine-dependent methyltransferase n=1 Tax=Arthrobacter crystallopoietes BAB-32 TaxID=1246476 RepID=N1V2L8_9MICC|nr:methyltransferase domain-containing protein [Arthrobacter crystallopoietes]EMY35595.1 S-adenosylmethionine-dependent methyltransferase [Arthrobacter crystallopoietes BAB-32]
MAPLPHPLDAAGLLRCPVCAAGIAPRAGSVTGGLRCAAGHSFDGAKQGYINLLTGRGTSFTPDTAEMVAARVEFLEGGHYLPLVESVAQTAGRLLADVADPVVVDAGAGTGHYLAAVLHEVPSARAVALDLSKYALRRAARGCPQALCLVWDLWRPLPLADRAADLMLNIFAPRNAAEYARVLKPGGHLLVVTPAPGHMDALRQLMPLLAIDEDKSDRLAAAFRGMLHLEDVEELVVPLQLGAEDVHNLVMMGPNAHHVDAAGLKGPDGPPTAVEARFTVSIFRKPLS